MTQAEIARLKARIAELEAELAARPPAAPAPATISADSSTPALRDRPARPRQETADEKKERRDRELRDAVKEAARKFDSVWFRFGLSASKMDLDEKMRMHHAAISAVCAAVREEVRARWVAEDAEEEALRVDLPWSGGSKCLR
jgi:hypothetical protein